MKKIISIFILSIIVISCNNNDDEAPKSNYDRSALLTNWANNIIVPSFVNYQSKLQVLVTDVTAFNTNANISNLKSVRDSWLDAYKAYQYVSMFNIGKAEELLIKETSNTYPTDVILIEQNLKSESYNLNILTNKEAQRATQGFPAIDYLINGLASNDQDIVGFYTTNTNAIKYKKYLLVLANQLKTISDKIVIDWNSGYKTSYIANNGTSVTSAVNETVNEFVKNLEKDIRTGKISNPAGIFSAGVVKPLIVEGFYKNDVSKILLTAALKASQDFFNGKNFETNSTGESLKSYLDFLNSGGNQKLSDVINNQFVPIFSSVNALNNSFSIQVNTDNSKMLATENALQQNVVYTKIDMMQALNISRDYVDGDGD